MSDSGIEMILAHVEVQARTRPAPQPENGEPLADYAARCMRIGACLAFEPISALLLGKMGSLVLAAQAMTEREQPLPQPDEQPPV